MRGPWYSSLRWRLAISLLALGVGVFFATTACMYPLRVVQRMSFVRDKGGSVHITTYSPFRGTRYSGCGLYSALHNTTVV